MHSPQDRRNAVAYAFQAVGGIGAAAKICNRSTQALSKWRQAACLPRTDYTGETCYASLLAEAARAKGNSFDASWLLNASMPQKTAA